MTVHYKIIKTAQPGVKGGGDYRYYARINNRTKTDLNKMAGEISERCSMRRSDVVAVLSELTELIPKILLQNSSIQLGDFGTFSLHAKSKPSESAEKVNEKNITDLKVAFRPGKGIKDEIKKAKFTKRNNTRKPKSIG